MTARNGRTPGPLVSAFVARTVKGTAISYPSVVPDFIVARNPEPDSTLPYLIRLPLGEQGLVLKTRETWPRTSKLYCHRAASWPEEAEVIEQVPVRSCLKRGAAIDLVLDRGRESRSQLVMTLARGREMIFWQTAKTAKKARPGVRTPQARAQGIADLEILVDSHERYAWSFAGEQVSTRKKALRAGDYGVEHEGVLLAVVERKSLEDLTSSLVNGKLQFQLVELASVPHAAIVVEERYSRIFSLAHVRPAVVADRIAECQARYPTVPIIFAETRPLAQQWTYRFLAACLDAHLDAASVSGDDGDGDDLVDVPSVRARPPVTPSVVRAWAVEHGYDVGAKGRIPHEVRAAYEAAHA